MSTAMVLPKFSDLCKDMIFDQESLELPPLRSFPESFSRQSPPSPSTSAGCSSSARHRLSISHLSGNGADSESSPCYESASWRENSCSRDSTPSDDSSIDMESERQYTQDPLRATMCQTERQKQSDSSPLTKPKKVKYHTCEICQKPFPRPSGLRAHMNMHTKEKPFECAFPGCSKRFSVSSNAKRHLRTHGVGLSPADEASPLPYVVDFEEPVVIGMESDDSSACEQINLKWMPLGAGTRRSYKTRNNHN